MSDAPLKQVGKRLFTSRSRDVLTIIIPQRIKPWQEVMLGMWLAAWLYCGVVFIYYLLTSESDGNRIFFLIASALWLFFFVRIGKVFLWRRVGKEVIRFSKGRVEIKNAFGSWGKNQVFYIRNIFKPGIIRKSDTNFFAFLDRSFWVMGGDTVGFSYSGQKIQFGKQLEMSDTQLLARITDQALREFRDDS